MAVRISTHLESQLFVGHLNKKVALNTFMFLVAGILSSNHQSTVDVYSSVKTFRYMGNPDQATHCITCFWDRGFNSLLTFAFQRKEEIYKYFMLWTYVKDYVNIYDTMLQTNNSMRNLIGKIIDLFFF
jgi:hypothetical protein